MSLCHGVMNPPHEELWKVMDQRLVLTEDLIKTMSGLKGRSDYQEETQDCH